MELATSFQGVSFSEEQKATLQKDLDLIDSITAYIAGLNQQYSQEEDKINNAKSQLDYLCNKLNGQQRSNCINKNNAQWDHSRSVQARIINDINVKKEALKAAEKNYNDDLDAIQNAIKFQIQASSTNVQSQVTVNQNDPRILLLKAKAEEAAKLKALELQATLDKQKRDSQVEVFGFITIVIVASIIGYFSLKKLGVL